MAPVNLRSKARNAKSKRSFSNNVPPGLHYLPPLDPKSEEFLDLFRSFLLSKDERKTILELSEGDARIFVDIIDRAFRAARLDNELRTIAFSVLRKLCGRIGYLPDSYLLSDKFDLSGMPRASGGFSDVRMGAFKGKDVAVKSLRISEMDDKLRIRRRFCKEVAMWKNLSHPNVLDLIGVPDTLAEGRFSMISEWMDNDNIMEYVRKNAGNHLKLLADAVEGLKYLHGANIVHGNLKSTGILITNTNPVSACVAGFGFTIIVNDPSLEMESSSSMAYEGTIPFMAPEVLNPYRFGLDGCVPSGEADVYAMAMVIYQALTGTTPFGNISGPKVVLKVLGGDRPSKPGNAPDLGLSDDIWKMLEDCWEEKRELRPPVKHVLSRVKSAARTCGILSVVMNTSEGYTEPDPGLRLKMFEPLFFETPYSEFPILPRTCGYSYRMRGTYFGAHDTHISGSSPSVSIEGGSLGLVKKQFDMGLSVGADRVVSILKDRSGAKQLEHDDAQKYADILDASLGEGTLDNQTRTQHLGCLRRLCGMLGILPSSFILVDTFDSHAVTPLAVGGYGSVSKMSFEGRRVAVKTLFVTQEAGGLKRIYKLLAREVVAWKWLQHKNILPFIGVTREFAIVSDFMENGNIMKFIAEHPSYNRLHLLMDAAHGLEYLHSHNVVHGDLKGANILIDSTYSARLADFGLTTVIGESTAGSTAGGYEPKGTTRWMAPEMLYPEQFEFPGDMQKQLPSKSTDIYALGMTALEVLTGRRPYNHIVRDVTVIFEVTAGKKPNRPLWGLSDGLWRLLLEVWEPEYGSQPPKRPSIRSMLDQLKEDADNWDKFIVSLQRQEVDEGDTTLVTVGM